MRGGRADLEPAMRPIAKRHLAGMLAGAPGHGFGLPYFNLLWRKPGSFVRAVAKGLRLRAPAGAPPVSARLDFLNNREFLIDEWVSHIFRRAFFVEGSLNNDEFLNHNDERMTSFQMPNAYSDGHYSFGIWASFVIMV